MVSAIDHLRRDEGQDEHSQLTNAHKTHKRSQNSQTLTNSRTLTKPHKHSHALTRIELMDWRDIIERGTHMCSPTGTTGARGNTAFPDLPGTFKCLITVKSCTHSQAQLGTAMSFQLILVGLVLRVCPTLGKAIVEISVVCDGTIRRRLQQGQPYPCTWRSV
jgi:hypothetical protein